MASIENLPTTTFSGRRFTRKQLEQICETVATFPKLSRSELARTVCDHLNWHNARGVAKTACCIRLLEALEAEGLVTLPKKRDADVAPKHRVQLEFAERDGGQSVEVCLKDLGPITLVRVVDGEARAAFKASIQAHHYLGYKHAVGNQLGYFIESQRLSRRLGCLSFAASSSWNLPARDQWIGWDERQRDRARHLVVTQQRFLIFPWVNVPNLASHVLSISEEQLTSDWLKIYGYRPVLLETFVDPTHFSGTCYQAANWQKIGQSQQRKRHPTEMRSEREPQEPETTAAKDIYVRPLTRHFQRELTENLQTRAVKKRYRNDLKASTTRRVDESFLELWKNVLHIIRDVAADYDEKWQVRRRVIDTLLLMLLIFRMVTTRNKSGYGTVIDELWDNCLQYDLALPQKESISPSSLCEARKKLDEHAFRVVNTKILQAYWGHGDVDPLWHGHRVFAVDGSKLQLPRALLKSGYSLPSPDAHYPQGLLSCLYALKEQLPVDFDLVAHGDERRCATVHLSTLHPGDVVVYDRGYFSYVMLHHHLEAGVHAVFRMPMSSASEVNKFMQSTETDITVSVFPSKPTLLDIAKAHPGLKIVPRTIRLVKYEYDKTTYCLSTTLVGEQHDPPIPVQELADLYHARWGVEELYKISKRVFHIEDFHAKHERGVKQELFAHFVLVTLNRLFANQAENGLNTPSVANTSPPAAPSPHGQAKVNFKNCVHFFARRMEPLLLIHKKLVEMVTTTCRSIAKCFQRVRPGRTYARQSKRPIPKWHSNSKKETRAASNKSRTAVVPAVAAGAI